MTQRASGPSSDRPVLVRDAGEADLPGILAIYNDAVAHTTAIWNEAPATLESRAALLAERRTRGYPFLVAEIAGTVAGYATFGDFRPFDGYRGTAEHSVYVRADLRGAGLGRALMGPLIAAAGTAGKHVLVGAIEADNAASIRLHEAFGFTRVGLMPQVGQKFGRWLDLLLMQKMLNDDSHPPRAPIEA